LDFLLLHRCFRGGFRGCFRLAFPFQPLRHLLLLLFLTLLFFLPLLEGLWSSTRHDNSLVVQFGNLTVEARNNTKFLPPAAATAATSPRASAEPASPATVGGFRTRFVHIHRAAVQFHTIQLRNRILRFASVRHFDESKTARLSCIAVRNNIDALDAPKLGECCM
jgi:hypothetical protein